MHHYENIKKQKVIAEGAQFMAFSFVVVVAAAAVAAAACCNCCCCVMIQQALMYVHSIHSSIKVSTTQ